MLQNLFEWNLYRQFAYCGRLCFFLRCKFRYGRRRYDHTITLSTTIADFHSDGWTWALSDAAQYTTLYRGPESIGFHGISGSTGEMLNISDKNGIRCCRRSGWKFVSLNEILLSGQPTTVVYCHQSKHSMMRFWPVL